MVQVNNIGYANKDIMFTYDLSISSLSSTQGSFSFVYRFDEANAKFIIIIITRKYWRWIEFGC